jgi:hypothetical protein
MSGEMLWVRLALCDFKHNLAEKDNFYLKSQVPVQKNTSSSS